MILGLFNRFIEHINKGRKIRNDKIILIFEDKEIPSDIEISKTGKILEDYMDKKILDYWKFYIK